MKPTLHWCAFGIRMALGTVMVMAGVLFMRNVIVTLLRAQGEIAFSSLILGVILLLVGGGLLSSSISRYVKKTCTR
jgi:hypothetical protein